MEKNYGAFFINASKFLIITKIGKSTREAIFDDAKHAGRRGPGRGEIDCKDVRIISHALSMELFFPMDFSYENDLNQNGITLLNFENTQEILNTLWCKLCVRERR